MSILLNNVYCSHWLRTNELRGFIKDTEYKMFHKGNLTCFHIKDSIHYKALITNNFLNYGRYVTVTDQKEHSIKIFSNLKDNFDIEKMKKIRAVYDFKTNKYIIHDGVHRLSLLVYKNIITDKIPLKYLNLTQNNLFYLVVYEHGINHINSICNKIEKANIIIHNKIQIILPSNKFTEFISDIYPDTNKKHILEKNKYIINKSKNRDSIKSVILLVSVDNVKIKLDKCEQIEKVKIDIRNSYNPKFKNINERIYPLNKGVSHNHVIHSTDLPKEFLQIYNVIDKYSDYTIDLMLFFANMKDYTIIKMDKNFPYFNIGKDDVDILSLNINNTIEHIKYILHTYYKKYTYKYNKIHNQLDIFYLNKFIIKFDLYDNLKKMYPNYDIPITLTKEVIKNSTLMDIIKVPLIQDELMIRRLEYDTWIKIRPDKIKHLNFILSHSNIEYKVFTKNISSFIYNYQQGQGGMGDYLKFFTYIYQESLKSGNKCFILKNNLILEKYIKLKDERMYITNDELSKINNKKIIRPHDLYKYFPTELTNLNILFMHISTIFQFSQEVLDNRNILLSSNIQDYISLHVRLGDKYIETDNSYKADKNDKRDINQDKINDYIVKNKNFNIILFCDNSKYKENMKKKFDNIIICDSQIGHTSFSNTTDKQILDTITELYIMSQSKKIIAGSISGFSNIAAKFHNIPIEYLADKKWK